MSNTYTWIFDPIEVKQTDDHADVVDQIHFRLSGVSEDSLSASVYGSVSCGDPGDDFIEFDSADFTEDLVKGWVIDGLGNGATEETVIAAVDAQITNQTTPKVVSKRPPNWSN